MHHQAHRFDGCGRGHERDETRETFSTDRRLTDDEIVAAALRIIDKRMRAPGQSLSSPLAVTDYLRLSIGSLEHEEFGVLWLDAQNRLIKDDRLFRGTITQTSVYPREIVKQALAHNAAFCILYHNHPSGESELSRADQALTERIKSSLELVDVNVIDHIIIAGSEYCSFAQRGLV